MISWNKKYFYEDYDCLHCVFVELHIWLMIIMLSLHKFNLYWDTRLGKSNQKDKFVF